jgi:hypothetical protein
MALGSTHPLTEMSTRELSQRNGRLERIAELTANLRADCLESVGASTSHNPVVLHGLLQG